MRDGRLPAPPAVEVVDDEGVRGVRLCYLVLLIWHYSATTLLTIYHPVLLDVVSPSQAML